MEEEERGIVMVLLADFGLSMFKGVVLVFLWKWFAVPFGLPQIGFFWALGICTGIAMLTGMSKEGILKSIERTDGEKLKASGYGYGIMALLWLFGWIYHLLIGVI